MSADKQSNKLNFDGSSHGNLGRAGRGGVIRDPRGRLILAYMANRGVQTSSMAEVAAVFHGLDVAREMGPRKLAVEGDSHNTIMMLNEVARPDRKTAPLIDKCRALHITFDEIRFCHVQCKENRVVDKLVGLGTMVNNLKVWFQMPKVPIVARAMILNDMPINDV